MYFCTFIIPFHNYVVELVMHVIPKCNFSLKLNFIQDLIKYDYVKITNIWKKILVTEVQLSSL